MSYEADVWTPYDQTMDLTKKDSGDEIPYKDATIKCNVIVGSNKIVDNKQVELGGGTKIVVPRRKKAGKKAGHFLINRVFRKQAGRSIIKRISRKWLRRKEKAGHSPINRERKSGTSMISFVKGKTEISHNLPNSTDGLVFLLHAVQSF
jgi:hypothetical protein